MKHTATKILALILTLIMVAGLLPAGVIARDYLPKEPEYVTLRNYLNDDRMTVTALDLNNDPITTFPQVQKNSWVKLRYAVKDDSVNCFNGGRFETEFGFVADGNIDVADSFGSSVPKVFQYSVYYMDTECFYSVKDKTVYYGNIVFAPTAEGAELDRATWKGSFNVSLSSGFKILKATMHLGTDGENAAIDSWIREGSDYNYVCAKPSESFPMEINGTLTDVSGMEIMYAYDDVMHNIVNISTGEGGTVTVPSSALETDFVEVCAEPDEGYYLYSLTVSKLGDESGESTKIVGSSFTMPAYDVVVSGEFRKILAEGDSEGVFDPLMTNRIANLALFFDIPVNYAESYIKAFIDNDDVKTLGDLAAENVDDARCNEIICVLAYESALKSASSSGILNLIDESFPDSICLVRRNRMMGQNMDDVFSASDLAASFNRDISKALGLEGYFTLDALKDELTAALADENTPTELPSYYERYKRMVYGIFCRLAEEDDYYEMTYEEFGEIIDQATASIYNLTDMSSSYPFCRKDLEDYELLTEEERRAFLIGYIIREMFNSMPIFYNNIAEIIEGMESDADPAEYLTDMLCHSFGREHNYNADLTLSFYYTRFIYAFLGGQISELERVGGYGSKISRYSLEPLGGLGTFLNKFFKSTITDKTVDPNGRLNVVTSATIGSMIEVKAEPAVGYTLDKITVYKAGDPSVIVPSGFNTFRLPDFDVVVVATFKPLRQPGARYYEFNTYTKNKNVYEYDENGLIIRDTMYQWKNNAGAYVPYQMKETVYDEQGRNSSAIVSLYDDGSWFVTEEYSTRYERDKVITDAVFNSYRENEVTTEYYYNGAIYEKDTESASEETFRTYYADGYGRPVIRLEKEVVGGVVKHLAYEKFFYDGLGYMVRNESYYDSGFGWIGSNCCVYEYDDEGKLAVMKNYWWDYDDEDWSMLRAVTEYFYTEDGFILREEYSTSDGEWNSTTVYYYARTIEDVTEDENGSISVPSSAVYGNVVTVDVLPEEGYRLESLVYSFNGVDHEIVGSDGVYQFVMEDADVTVCATFTESEEKLFDDYKDEVCDALEDLLDEEFGEIVEETIEEIQELVYDPSLTLDENKDRVVDVLYEMLDELEAWKWDQLGFFGRHKVYLQNLWEKFSEKPVVKADLERLGAFAEALKETLSEGTAQAVKDAEDLEKKIDEVIIDTTDKINQTIEEVKEKVEEKTEEVSEKINDTIEDLKEKTEDAIEKAGEIIGDKTEQAEGSAEWLKNHIEEKTEVIKDKLEEAGEEIADAAGKAIGVNGNICEVGEKALEIGEKALEIGENVGRTVGDAADNVTSTLGSLKEKADAAAEAGNQVVAPIAAGIAAFSEEAQNNIETAKERVNEISEKVDEVSNKVEGAVSDVKAKVNDAKEKAAAAAAAAKKAKEAAIKAGAAAAQIYENISTLF